MIVDCQSCPVRGVRCDGCMVTELYAVEPATTAAAMDLDSSERAAVQVLLEAGLLARNAAMGLRARREPWASFRAVG